MVHVWDNMVATIKLQEICTETPSLKRWHFCENAFSFRTINVHWINVFVRIVLLNRYFLFGDERLNKHWIIINQNTNTKCTLSEMLKAQIPWNCTVFTLTAYSQKWSYHSPAVDVRVTKSSLAFLQITEMGLVSVQDLHYIVLLI